MKKIFFYFTVCLFFASCVKTVTVDIPQKDPKLVVNGLLAKDLVISTFIGKSRSVLDPRNLASTNLENYVVKNATAIIYENNVAIDTLVYQPAGMNYKSIRQKTIKPGSTYTIKVSAAGFTSVEAATILPSQSIIAEVKRVKNARTTADGEQQDQVIVKLDDPSETNFYLIRFMHASSGSWQGYPIYCVSTTDKDIEPIGENADPFSTDNCYDGNNILLQDVNFNGKQKQLVVYINSLDLQDETDPTGQVYKPYVIVSRITAEHFKYVKSYNIYYNTSDNPFAEPTNVFTNVKNGFGVFAAYTTAMQTIN